MLSKIETLIDKQDTNEIVRDQIAAILAIEFDRQKDLARIAEKNPIDWVACRVIPKINNVDTYIERLRPWEALSDGNGEEISETSLVNVSFDNDTFDNKGSDTVGRQKVKGIFYLDCYAHKNSYEENGIFKNGDEMTSKESDRVARLVRNIIMADIYTYLGIRDLVSKRFIIRREKFLPSDREGKFFENIIATRITLEVTYDEFSPQSEGVALELLVNECKLNEDGLITFSQSFDLKE